jgi:hypothetical protein
MTKPTGTGRGGKREGAGRKARPPGVSLAIPAAPAMMSAMSAHELAKHYATLAVETLAVVAADGAQPASARVAASREILDRSEGKAKPGTPVKADQADMFADDGWGELLKPREPAGRAN